MKKYIKTFEIFMNENKKSQKESEEKGEYYVDDLDEDKDGMSGYGVFHTDKGDGKCYGTFLDKEEAQKCCDKKNDK